jgi:hypothetical protein
LNSFKEEREDGREGERKREWEISQIFFITNFFIKPV